MSQQSDSNAEAPAILLYTTAGCHLCEQAEALLEPVVRLNRLHWRPVDIAESEQLVERYGLRIPVIRVDGASQDLGWPFDEPQLLDYLSRHL